jgi:hypothetical protein
MKTIFEYLGIEQDRTISHNGNVTVIEHKFPDGNLMVFAINKMRERNHYHIFRSFANTAWIYDNNVTAHYHFDLWLFGSPENFFRLMQEAIEKGVLEMSYKIKNRKYSIDDLCWSYEQAADS